MKKLLMEMILVACATVGSAQGLPGRTLGRRLQRFPPSAARDQQLHTTTTNGVEWTYEVARGHVFLGNGDRWLSAGKKAKSAVPQGTAGVLIIPETIAGMPVRGIGICAFSCCSNLTSVTIPSSVKEIGGCAFSDCSGLTNVTIPSDLKNVDYSAFSGCTNLKAVNVVKDGKIEVLPFDDFCKKLQSVNENGIEWTYAVDDGGVVLGSGEWRLSPGKKAKLAVPQSTSGALIIPETLAGMQVRGIGIGAFSGCSNLTSVAIPSSVRTIRNQAFENCVGLTSMTIPSSVMRIDDSAFSGCCELKSFVVDSKNQTYSSANGLLCSKDGRTLIQYVFGDGTIPSSVKNIGGGAFKNCSRLKSIKIPSSVDNVGRDAFKGCSGLTSLEIADGVNSIGSDAFSGCSNLTSVTIPSSVKNVGWRAFSNCAGLREVTLSEGVTNVESQAFWRCRNLTSITLPMSLKTIESDAFGDCRELRSVKIPSSVTSIRGSPFSGCSKLETITIPPCVKKMSDVISTWDGGTNIKEVVMYEGVTSIGRSMFERMTSLKSVTIPSSVTNIGDYAFQDCSGLTSVTIPTGVRKIGRLAFADCSGLTSVTMPSGLKNIDATAFSGCKNLKTVDVVKDGNVESLSFDEFCKRLNSVKVNGVEWTYEVAGDGVVLGSGSRFVVLIEQAKLAIPRNTSGALVIPDALAGMPVRGLGIGAFSCCSNLTSVTIPSSVTSIGKWAFKGCEGLTSVTIPSSVTSIGSLRFAGRGERTSKIPLSVTGDESSVFEGCSGLKSFVVDPKNQTYSSTNGLLCSKDGRILVRGVNGDVVIPPSVTNIAYGAFGGSRGLTSVTIPSSVTSIGEFAFAECSGLMSINVDPANPTYCSTNGLLCSKDRRTLIQGVNGDVEIPTCVTNIGYGAFDGCRGLTSVTIPSSVTIVEWAAFSGCSGLTSVTIPPSVASWGKDNRFNFAECVFEGCSGLKSVTILPGVMSIEASMFSGCSNLTSVTIPSSVTNISMCAFENCVSLKTVTIPSSVTSVEDRAFFGCSGLKSFVVDSANPVYSSVNGLLCSKDGRVLIRGINANVTIPSSVVTVGYNSFSGFGGLTSVTIPTSVTNIVSGAFSNCGKLISVMIPQSVTSIGWDAFSKTPFYENKPDGVVILGGGVLYKYKGKCPSSVAVPSGVISIEDGAFSDSSEQVRLRASMNGEGADVSRFSELTSVMMPSSVRKIGRAAFSGCGKLSEFSVDPNNKVYASTDGILYNKSKTDLIQCPAGKKGSVTIPEGVMRICDAAFSCCSGLASVVIPASVTNIGRSAFSRCKELASLSIPSCVTNVHSSAFSGCSKLKMVNVAKDGMVEQLPFDEFCERWNLTNPGMNWRRRNRRSAGSKSRTVAPTNGGNSATNAEMAEQRRQLLAILEELSRVRGAKSASVQNAGATGGGSTGGSLRARRLQRQQETQSSAVKKHEKQESKDAEQQRKVEKEKK